MGEEMTAGKFAWIGARLCCKAILDFLYTLLVVVLTVITVFIAYISTLDELPVPQFIIKELESRLTAQGMALNMDGIRLRPNGRIIIESPEIISRDFEARVGEADFISLKIDMALALVGHIKVNEVSISNGLLKAPPVLSPTGLSETIIEDVDLTLERGRGHWNLAFGKLIFGNAKLFASGDLGADLLKTKLGQEPSTPLKESIIENLRQIWELKDRLKLASQPFASISLIHSREDGQQAIVSAFSETLHFQESWKARQVATRLEFRADSSLVAKARIKELDYQDQYRASDLIAATSWSELPRPEKAYPKDLVFGAGDVSIRESNIGAFLAELGCNETSLIDLKLTTTLGDQPWKGRFNGDIEQREGIAQFEGLVDAAVIDLVAQATGNDFSSVSIPEKPAEISLTAVFDGSLQPSEAQISLVSDVIVANEARFENAIAKAQKEGDDFLVENLWLRSGSQNGWMSIAFNPETKKRRFLIDGSFNPKTLNGWFPPWWDNFWDNFVFPEQGFHTLLDTSAVLKQPDAYKLTGIFAGENVTIRGHEMEAIRTKLFNRIYYFDLYDMNVRRKEGSLVGETQIAMGKDPRDGIEKLVGLWVNAESTIDLGIGPDVISEVGQETAEILEPYQYETPPRIKAFASNVRIRDDYQYDIDLKIDTEEPLVFYDFPFESVEADVSIDNSVITVSNAKGGVGGGQFHAEATIIEDDIELETTLKGANFGGTLVAAAKYFDASESDELDEEPIDMEELAAYDGVINASFDGKGIVGDTLSYTGKGEYKIDQANFGQIQLFGLLSKAMQATPFRFTTLRFNEAYGAFEARKRYVHFPDLRLTGPMAQVNSEGNYDLEEDTLDFKAKLFPFRNSQMPIVPLLAVVLDPVSRFMEVRLTGTLEEPKWRLFSPSDTNTELPEAENPPQDSPENPI